MLRFIQSLNAEQANGYFTEGLTREDYYVAGQEIAGRWHGKGAELLGIQGLIAREQFRALCNNLHPAQDRALTAKTVANRRVGYDINFHAPKSVSLLHAMTGDEGILNAFRDSVQATMELMESEMETRVRKGGKFENRTTGNCVWAEFVHLTARPVDGIPDPHLHAHCFTFNATYDSVEKQWKAGEFAGLKKNAPFFEAVFHATFADRLREMGYHITRRGKGWELEGIPRSAIEKFSRRTDEIERLAKEKGIVTAREKDRLGAATRKHKRMELKRDELKVLWRDRLSVNEQSAIRSVEKERARAIRIHPELSTRESMDHAVTHLFERQSAVPKRKILEVALRHGVGSVTLPQVDRALHHRLTLREVLEQDVRGEAHCTTRKVLDEEREMLAFARDGRATCRPLNSKEFTFQEEFLTLEQQHAGRQLLESQDRVSILRGRAGVGKTTLMREVIRGIKEGGKDTLVFAPSAEASRGTLRKEGFTTAETVAKLLTDKTLQARARGQVIWIDEAGLSGSRTLQQVFKIADRVGARVVLSGDPGQHTSVDRGDAMRLLVTRGGLSSPEVKTIQRQRGTYRDAVMALSEGRIADGVHTLDSMGAIRELPAEERYKAMALEYVSAIANGQSVLAVSPTHREGEVVSDLIRRGLRDQGKIAPMSEERGIVSLKQLAWTEAERADARSYTPGLCVQFHLHAKGFGLGERGRIITADKEGVTVSKEDGRTVMLPLHEASRFQVYVPSELRIARGDLIRFTQNGITPDRKHRLRNGTLHQVRGFAPDGNIVLANGWTIPPDFGHLTHGYVATSHAAQGKTVDRVLIAQSAESVGAASREQFYVSVSRGRQGVTIYTDDRQALLKAVEKSGQRLSAIELMGEGPEVRQAALVARLAARARMWASRQVERIATAVARPMTRADDLLARHGSVKTESAPPLSKANEDLIRRLGGIIQGNDNKPQKGKDYDRDRERD